MAQYIRLLLQPTLLSKADFSDELSDRSEIWLQIRAGQLHSKNLRPATSLTQ